MNIDKLKENVNNWLNDLLKDPIFIFYATINNFNKFKNKKANLIRKEYKKIDISKLILPPEFKIDKEIVIFKNIDDEKMAAMIANFTLTLQRNFNKEDLVFLYRNAKSLNIHQIKTDFSKLIFSMTKGKNLDGLYTANNNSIIINKECLNSSLYHELFHMVTVYSDKEKTLCGFAQGYITNYDEANYDNAIILGKAINEGYTEIMANRYFDVDISKSGYSYYIEVASGAEQIVGESFMEKQYMHANLKELVIELAKYSSSDEAMNFIKNLDFYHFHIRDKRKIAYERKLLKKCKRDCALYLINTFENKMKMEYNNGIIPVYDALVEIDKFITPFFNGNINHFLNKNDQKNIMKKIKQDFNIYSKEELQYAYYRDSVL